MTEKDRELLRFAETHRWDECDGLEDMAETPEGRYAIHSAVLGDYHREECRAGLL